MTKTPKRSAPRRTVALLAAAAAGIVLAAVTSDSRSPVGYSY